jgi:hypothetical protein
MRQERQIPHPIQDATPSGQLDLRSNAKICEMYVAGSYAGMSLPQLHGHPSPACTCGALINGKYHDAVQLAGSERATR